MSMMNYIALEYFSIQHFAMLLYIPLIVVAFYFIFRHRSERTKNIALLSLSFVNALLFIIYKFAMFRNFDNLEILNELPLQLCNLNLILIPIALITKNKVLMSYLYYIGMIAALCAIFFFDSRFEGYNMVSYIMFVYFFYHSVLVATPLLSVLLGLYTPEKSYILKAILLLVIMATIMLGFNLLLRVTGLCKISNYFYTMGMPGNPILDLLMSIIPIPLVYYFPMAPILYGYDYLIAMPFKRKNNTYKYEVIG